MLDRSVGARGFEDQPAARSQQHPRVFLPPSSAPPSFRCTKESTRPTTAQPDRPRPDPTSFAPPRPLAMLGTAARSWPGAALLAVSTLLVLYVRHDALRTGVLRWESRGVAGTGARAYWLDAHGTLPADRGMGAATDRPRRAWRPGTRADPTYPNFCSTSSAAAATACNGHEEYCSRTYSNVSVIGAHDSYSVGAGNSAPFSLPRVGKG